MNKPISTGEKFLKSKARLFWGPKVLSFCLKIVPQFGNELAGDDEKKGETFRLHLQISHNSCDIVLVSVEILFK